MSDVVLEERVGLKQIFRQNQRKNFSERTRDFTSYSQSVKKTGSSLFHRNILSPTDRVVKVASDFEPQIRDMLMFGSNNYLGFANHPYIKEQVKHAIDVYGVGVGGPPVLNGNHFLLTELERRLAGFKGYDDALVFPSGYATNLGLFSSLPLRRDTVVVDIQHHASCFDGLKLGKIPFATFLHNDVEDLEAKLLASKEHAGTDSFIGVEGVYSMQGDLACMPALVAMARKHQAVLVIDDAHGTGVIGELGKGVMSHFQQSYDRCLSMGTFSKTFAVTGGFVCGNRDVVEYLRYFARSYLFSGSISPIVCAAVIAGIDLLENEPEHQQRLMANKNYAVQLIRQLGIDVNTESAILILPLIPGMRIDKVAKAFHLNNIFVNTIEYPAVDEGSECVRLSFSACHTQEDIERLVEVIEALWVLTSWN